MWFPKQGPALAFHDAHPDHIILAEDISSHGHKRYGVIPRDELIRTHSVCRLYFDLDGGARHSEAGGGACEALIETVSQKLLEVYALQLERKKVIVLCSCSETKFSKHLVFPVYFRNNWEHMKNFVRLFQNAHPLVDTSVYSRNRCWGATSMAIGAVCSGGCRSRPLLWCRPPSQAKTKASACSNSSSKKRCFQNPEHTPSVLST